MLYITGPKVSILSPNSTWFVSIVTSRHDSTRSIDVSSESRRACRVVLCQLGGRRTSYIVLACTSLVVFMLLNTQILFVSNKINKCTLGEYLHITLYKLHNKLSYESRLSRSSCRASRTPETYMSSLECVESCCSTSSTQPNCMGSTRRTCRVVSRRDESSGICAIPCIYLTRIAYAYRLFYMELKLCH